MAELRRLTLRYALLFVAIVRAVASEAVLTQPWAEAAHDDRTPPYPGGFSGYWQGTMEIGRPATAGSYASPAAVQQYKVQLVFAAGRRIAPPDTSLPMDQRHTVVWETLNTVATGPNTGRFCEALSFNSKATVAASSAPAAASAPGTSYEAALMQMPGMVCGIYNHTGDQLTIAWAAAQSGAGAPVYPDDYTAGGGAHVARLQLLTPEVFPAELEGQWGGVQLLAGNDSMVQGEARLNLACTAGRCVFRGPVAPHSGQQESAVVVTDVIFFQRAGATKGKFCEIVTFSSAAPVAVTPDTTYGRLQHGTEVHCNVYKRVGRTLVLAWSSDGSGAAPQNFRPDARTVVATLDLESEHVAVPEIQGRWKGFIREKVGDGAVQATPALMSCAFGSCVLAEAAGPHAGVRIYSVASSRGTGLGTGQLCEVLAGSTSADENMLQLTEERMEWEAGHASERRDNGTTDQVVTTEPATERLLRPSWGSLGSIRCTIFERKGSILKLATSLESTERTLGRVPDGFQPKAGLASSATFVLQPAEAPLRPGHVAMSSGAYGLAGSVSDSWSTTEVSPVNARLGGANADNWAASPSLSAYVAAPGELGELPPTELPRNMRMSGAVTPGAQAEQQNGPTLKDWSITKRDDANVRDAGGEAAVEPEVSVEAINPVRRDTATAGSVLGKMHQQLGVTQSPKLKPSGGASTAQASSGTTRSPTTPLRPLMLLGAMLLLLFAEGY